MSGLQEEPIGILFYVDAIINEGVAGKRSPPRVSVCGEETVLPLTHLGCEEKDL